MRYRCYALSIALAMLAALSASASLACSCRMDAHGTTADAVRRAYKNASAVLIGQVLSVTATRFHYTVHQDFPAQPANGEVTTFSVVQSWKGNAPKTLHTRIATECCVCGISFEAGERYLLYLYGPDKDGYYRTNSCSRTARIQNAEDDIRVLNGMRAREKPRESNQ